VIALLVASSSQMPSVRVRVDEHSYSVSVVPSDAKPLHLVERGKIIDRVLKGVWKPWHLEAADVDGDGRIDIAVGIVKPTRYIPQPHKTLWIFGIREGHFTRKWLGSTMGRPLLEFCFATSSSKGGQPLFTLERNLENRVALSRYYWSGFGFRKLPIEKTWKEAHGLHWQNGKIVVIGDGLACSFLPEDWK
jgi:hypothetical protein